MKTLNSKLISLYVISVFIIVTVVFMVTEYLAYNRAETNALQLMEIGPGYINGATPDTIATEAKNNGENIHALLSGLITGNTATSVLNDFDLLFSSSTPSGFSDGTKISILPEKFNSANYYTLEASSSNLGPLSFGDDYFPLTISSYLEGLPWRRLYYSAVDGYDGIVIISSLDIRFLPEHNWLNKVPGDVIMVSPLVAISAVLLGFVITRLTVSPITKLTIYAEKLAAGALHERTTFASSDELGRLACSLNKMATKLQKTFDTQKKFVSSAAHEMKTPLASMKTAVTGALTNNRTDEKYLQLMEFLSDRIYSQERLINDLLLQAKADEVGLSPADNKIDIIEVINKVSTEFAPVFEEHSLTLTIVIEESLKQHHPYVSGNIRQLSSLFSNLIDNAIKNTPDNGEIGIEITLADKGLIIKVSDTGCGIAPEHLDKIFSRFYKVTEDRTPESGFGLGLSICQSIATRHGGNITVESTPGKGSIFTIDLPLVSK